MNPNRRVYIILIRNRRERHSQPVDGDWENLVDGDWQADNIAITN